MTTINNHESLIEKVGGIEKAKAIVAGAPESNFPVKWGLSFKTYFRQVGYFVEQWFESKWQTRYSDSDWVDLETLSTAIEHHYYGRSEAEELAAYAELSHEKIEGVMTFDEWWKVNELKYDYVFPASRDAFKAGQKSRQAEINRLEEWNSNQARSIKTYQSEDKDLKALLQKLIDDEYTTMRPSMAYEIQKALRGEHD